MADNVELSATSGGDVIAADDVSGVKIQRVKVVLGADGSNDGDVASGNPLPIAGTVTANLSATDNGVLDDIAASLATLDNVVDGNEAQVDVVSSALPTGAATAANQATIIGHVDGVETLLGTIDADTSTLAGAVAGSEVQVDVVASLPAGTNNIGDVDVLTLPAVAGEAADTMNASSSDGATALTNGAQAIKASAGRLCGYYIHNPNEAPAFVQFYNVVHSSVTVGTTNPLFMLTIPASSAANLWMQPGGVTFSTAMSWAATSTAGGNGALSTALDAVAFYK